MMRFWLPAVVLASIVASELKAADVEFEIHNLSNSDVLVAQAFAKGKAVSGGWTRIGPNEERSFRADWSQGLGLRIETRGQEVTFPNFQNFLVFDATQDRFRVTNTDNPNIRTLEWGSNLEKKLNVYKNGKLPNGWARVRFFGALNPGKYHLEILP